MGAPWERYQATDKGPWAKYQTASAPVQTAAEANSAEGLPADFPRHMSDDSTGDWWKKELSAFARPEAWARQAKLAGRSAVEAIEALPMLAMDMGVSGRNMLTGSNYDLPSQVNRESLNTALPEARTPQEKTAAFAEQLLAGAKLPVPQAAQQAPANFVKPAQDLARQQTLLNGQRLGLAVPPSTTNPTITNKVLESLGGKIATAQDAATKNQGVFSNIAKRTVGMNEDYPLTAEGLSAIRKEAGDAYATLRKVGEVKLDQTTISSLDSVASKFTGSKLKEALGGGNNIPKIVQAIKDEPLNGDSAVDAIDLLRNEAGKAYSSGDKQLGKAYRTLSETIENLMERNLSGDALKEFKDARQLIAKTYSVEGALNPATGNIAGTKLAAQLTKGKPLSGDLKAAARFAQAFPKASAAVNDSGSVRNTDVIMGAGTAALSKEPMYLLYPFLRQGARNLLLSKSGQELATAGVPKGIPPSLAMMLLQSEEQLRTR